MLKKHPLRPWWPTCLGVGVRGLWAARDLVLQLFHLQRNIVNKEYCGKC